VNYRRSPTNRRQAGFGLLEALVALVLLSSVGFTLLAWIQQNLDTLQRLRGIYAEVDAHKSVLAWSRSLNPMERPSGEVTVGTLRLNWKAVGTGEPVTQTGYPAGMGLHDLALYDVSITVYRLDRPEPWFVQKIVSVGHIKARENRLPFAGG
jgi:general secretion pathway protein I